MTPEHNVKVGDVLYRNVNIMGTMSTPNILFLPISL